MMEKKYNINEKLKQKNRGTAFFGAAHDLKISRPDVEIKIM